MTESSNKHHPGPSEIRSMFDRLARRYDLFNRVTSLGMDRRWRACTLEPVHRGMRVLDIGCGTGDLALEAAEKLNGDGEVVGIDFSEPMLELARSRAEKSGLPPASRPRFVHRGAETLPLDEKPFDLAVSGFVLRNVYEHIDAVLSGVQKSLREGGAVSFLDITEPEDPMLRAGWRFYMFTFVALVGKLVFGRDYPAFYLTSSAKRFPKPREFTEKLRRSGFERVETRTFLFGVIVLYQAVKSPESVRVASVAGRVESSSR